MGYISLADTILDLVGKALDGESLPPECNVSTPPQKEMGDLSFACYPLAKTLRQAPAKIAEELSKKISGSLSPLFSEVRATGPYLNFFVSSQELACRLLHHITDKGERYGSAELEQPQTVVIDYSSPNVAKPFGIGHLRSTNIGGALARIYRFLGWKVIGINYLGDWGTSYGLLIEAFLKSGSEEELRQDPIEYAYRLYVDYRQKAKNDPSIIEQARRRFRLLEEGEAETQRLWRMFRQTSLDYLEKIYQRLNISFEAIEGESMCEDQIKLVLGILEDRGLSKKSDGALVMEVGEEMPPLLLVKSDGTTLYHTRDLATAYSRYEKYRFDKMIYVVGAPQALHFRQLFAAFKILDVPFQTSCEHIKFGHILGMKTREGNLILLEEVLDEAKARATECMQDALKNRILEMNAGGIDEISEDVGVGAIIFNDLKSAREKDVKFDWEQILNFTGHTGPYLQYTHARLASIIRKAGDFSPAEATCSLIEPEERDILVKLDHFPEIIRQCAAQNEPYILSHYLLILASDVNTFYAKHRVIQAPAGLKESRLMLIDCCRKVLNTGIRLLGFKPLEVM
jgi:arginyl-tRNA synthetase